MASKIYIAGNFLIAEDSITRDIFFKSNVKNVHHLRSPNDDFAFFQDGLVNDIDGQPQTLGLGVRKAWEWDTQELEQPSQTGFAFADIVDFAGLPYASSNALDDYLNDNIGSSGGNGGLTHVTTDATLTGDGTVANPLKVVQNSGLSTKSGVKLLVDFSGNPKIAHVIFANPFVNANYSPVITCETSGGFSYVPNVENVLATGFDINMTVNIISNLTAVHWVAIYHGETL